MDKNISKILVLITVLFSLLFIFSGCSGNSSGTFEKKKMSERTFIVKKPVSGNDDIMKGNGVRLDASHKEDGYIMVSCKKTDGKALKVLVNYPNAESCNYDILAGDEPSVIPLPEGDGTYNIGVYKNMADESFATVYSADIDVKLNDAFTPFLITNEYIKFDEKSNVVKVAEQIAKNETDQLKIIEVVYDYVTKNISYDYDFANEVIEGNVSGYIPNPDKTLKAKKGICFDYAVLMTAMLRSQDIPTKLLIGYAGDVYHAWVNVYSRETGKIDKVIKFDGDKYTLMDPTFSASLNDENQLAEYMGDGTKYQEKYVY